MEQKGVSTYFGKRSISFHWFLNASNDDCAIGDDVSKYAGRAVSGLGLPLTTGSLDYGIHTKETKGNVNGAPKLFTENMSNGTLKVLNQKHPEANEPPQEEGVGEVLRKIAGKTVMILLKSDVLQAAGSLQLCGGKVVGSEAMIHIFNDDNTVGILLIDVEDGFNSIN